MSKLHFQNFQENDQEISFDIRVTDDTMRHTYGWRHHVVITKPLNPGKIRTAINQAETDILNELDANENLLGWL